MCSFGKPVRRKWKDSCSGQIFKDRLRIFLAESNLLDSPFVLIGTNRQQ